MAVASTNESISPASIGTSTRQIAMTIRLMGSTDAAASLSFSSSTCFWYKTSLLFRNITFILSKSARAEQGQRDK